MATLQAERKQDLAHRQEMERRLAIIEELLKEVLRKLSPTVKPGGGRS